MFAAEYKRPVPKYIRTLGVVTAPTGAAVRDIINVATRRNPYIQIILYPALVQGEAAAASIANGIRALERQGVDAMIVGRGGGSMEDLWAFNEELVAQAIFDCEVPVISAVGHETDTTIADFVSDLRAPTPSAAAELAVCDYVQRMLSFREYKETLYKQMRIRLQESRSRAEKLQLKLNYLSPAGKIRDRKTHVLSLEERLQDSMQEILSDRRHRFALLVEQMRGLSPLAKLNQGYAYVENGEGSALKKTAQVKTGETITVHVTDGEILAQVTDIISREA